ncbi:hypothetical protein NDA18_003931 [Ustilago nuda]|nr:hypothetical protein NDA18_003931 [Ustilago nuda]
MTTPLVVLRSAPRPTFTRISRNACSIARSYSTTPGPEKDLISELESRNLVSHLTSRSLRTHLLSAPRTVYSGVDPSASSLHVGNLLPLLTLAHFARYGHRPIVLVGGATGCIGDPSGRSTERNALDEQTLEENVAGIKCQLRSFFENVQRYYGTDRQRGKGGEAGEVQVGMGVRMMNNYQWTKDVTLLDFLGTVGRHARLTSMLSRESVASRLTPPSASTSEGSIRSACSGGGMSYTEFSYQLLQAFDFLHLHKTTGCTIQLGGSDQLGNITAGIDLIRRTWGLTETEPAYGLTLPLLTTSSGEKFGKSAGNAIWLDPLRTPDLHFYQFFLRSTDADVEKYLLALTLLEPEKVRALMQEHRQHPKQRVAQKVLADHITELIRGRECVETSRRLSQVLFAQGDVREALAKLDIQAIAGDEGEAVVKKLNRHQVVGQQLTKVVSIAGLVKSRGEAKRLLANGGLYLNNEPIKSERGVAEDDLVALQAGGAVCLVKAGKGAVRILYLT